MTGWSLAAAAYGGVLTAAALAIPVGRRPVVLAASAAYVLVALATGTLAGWLWVDLAVPGILLVTGYWLSGFFFRDPQPWLERWLLASDAWVFRALRVDAWLGRAPRWVLELVEIVYALDYVVIGGGAIAALGAGRDRLAHYWSLVLAAELACYVALPWLRSRPPRALEPAGVVARRAPAARRLNDWILDRASVQANTVPSGHVAGAAAAALALLSVDTAAGVLLLVVAVAIAAAAVAGRYHYVVDCAAGVAVALAAWLPA
jgi:hypothetical protein